MGYIEELLEQKSVSGEELGRLIIYNDICLYQAQLGLEPDMDELPIGQDVLNALTDRISTVEDAETLECYMQLQNFIRYAQAISYAYNQQAQNGFCRLLMYMTQAQQIEHARYTLEMLPMIMTETQFREMPPPGPIARQRGVAIVANHFPCRPICLDANDYFVMPELDCFQEMMSLEHAAGMAEKLEYFRNDLLLDGLRRQSAYNKLFELIAERLEIAEFTAFCTDITGLTEQIAAFNQQQEEMLHELAGEGEAYKNKLEIMRTLFRPIDIADVNFSDDAVEKVREKLQDLNVFRHSMNDLIGILLGEGEADVHERN